MVASDTGHEDATTESQRERYRREREKRMRTDGVGQYLELDVLYHDVDADPYVEPGFTREAVVDELDVVIIGGGFGGMLTAINLRKAGVDNFRIIDKAGDFGGTWYWNRYPGAACDVESYSYLPMLEETGFMPTEKYSKAPEIFGYCQLLARTFDLYDGALFQTEVADVVWNDDTHRWTVTTNRGDRLVTRFVAIAGGVLHKAKLPGIDGIETYRGHTFHTSRWDYAYTGGSPLEPLSGLHDKRVGIIGTGATAVQAIPHLGAAAQHLYVFQRTPSPVGPRNNRPTDPEWFRAQAPGWQQRRIDNFTALVIGDEPSEDLIQDGWGEMLFVDTRTPAPTPERQQELERIDFDNMQRVRDHIAAVVTDPETARKLQPWYGMYCKRLCFHDEYLPTFNRPNVTLVDTDGHGVDRIDETGIWANGEHFELDCIIYASGFEVMTDYTHRLGFDPKGHDGRSLSDAWADGPHTLHGIHTRGFPNLLMLSTVQGGQAINFLHTITATAAHVAYVVRQCIDDGIDTIEPTEAAQDAWFETIFATLLTIADYNSTCTPGYLNNEGSVDPRSARAAAYLGRPFEYIDRLAAWRADGTFAGLDVTR